MLSFLARVSTSSGLQRPPGAMRSLLFPIVAAGARGEGEGEEREGPAAPPFRLATLLLGPALHP